MLRKDRKSPGVIVESMAYEKEYTETNPERMCLRVGCVKVCIWNPSRDWELVSF